MNVPYTLIIHINVIYLINYYHYYSITILFLLLKGGDELPKMPPGSFYKPKFFNYLLEEYTACREAVNYSFVD